MFNSSEIFVKHIDLFTVCCFAKLTAVSRMFCDALG